MFREFAGLLKRASAVAGVASLVALAGHAQAAQFLGEWDPAFGSPYTDLGWKGAALFEVPDACLANDGTYVNGFGCASGFGLKMISAQVVFYDIGDPSETPLDTLFFTAPSATVTMEVTNNSLSGVVGLFLTPDRSTLDIAGGNTDFWLSFVESDGDSFARLFFKEYGTCGRFIQYPCIVDWGYSQITADPSGRPFMTFTQLGLEVPEPGSLALLIPALGMLGIFRRRRTAI